VPKATSTPKATATPEGAADVQVGKYRVFQPQYGERLSVVGEVNNVGTAIAMDVQVAIAMYDAAGTIVGSGEASWVLPMIPAGGKSPYEASIEVPDTAAVAETRIQVQFETYDSTAFIADYYTINLEIGQVAWNPDQIVGEVVNPTDAAIKSVYVLVIGYDAAGEVFGVKSIGIDLDEIGPGGNAPFSSSYLGYGDDVPATVEAYAWGVNP